MPRTPDEYQKNNEDTRERYEMMYEFEKNLQDNRLKRQKLIDYKVKRLLHTEVSDYNTPQQLYGNGEKEVFVPEQGDINDFNLRFAYSISKEADDSEFNNIKDGIKNAYIYGNRYESQDTGIKNDIYNLRRIMLNNNLSKHDIDSFSKLQQLSPDKAVAILKALNLTA